MSSKKPTITELNQLLITELYESYREKSESFIEGRTFFENIKKRYQDQFYISENDFIISLNSLESMLIIKQLKTMAGGIPLKIQVKPFIINYCEKTQLTSRNLQKITTNQTESKNYLKINFRDYDLVEFDRIKNLINRCAYDDDLYSLLPFLFRLILEKLLYQIYLKTFDNNQKFLYFSHQPKNFSKLISLLNIIKDNEIFQYHSGSINQDIITILKEVQKKGNLTVHQIIRQIDKEYINSWRDKIERVLENLLVLYRNLPENEILIEDDDRLEKSKRVLGIIKSHSQKKLKNVKKVINQELINEDRTQFKMFFKLFSGKMNYSKGFLINLIKKLGKEKIEKFLNLGYSDKGSMIILRILIGQLLYLDQVFQKIIISK